MPTTPPVVLASASPRRAALLEAADIAHEVRITDTDERVLDGETPDVYVERLAITKARAAQRADDEVVIGADTCVVIDSTILGKPVDESDARRMLRTIAGRTHTVHTGLALVLGASVASAVNTTTVTVAALDDDTIDAYIATGEPLDKAGAYGLQGIGGLFVTAVDGSPSNVIGLPLHQLRELAASLHVHLGP